MRFSLKLESLFQRKIMKIIVIGGGINGLLVSKALAESGNSVTLIEKGEILGEVESSKSVSEISAPLTARVFEVNDDLELHPMKINDDPYGEGWVCLMNKEDSGPISGLLDADSYRLLLEG